MRQVLVAVCLALSFSSPSFTPTFAQAPSQFDLVRRLRENGLTELALRRLEELKATPSLVTADEAKVIPFEIARIKLEDAAREGDEARRSAMILQARVAFEDFINVTTFTSPTAEA